MQVLPLTLTHDGFILTQLARDGRVALYAQHKGTRLNSYEVILVQTHREHTWPNGQVTPVGEHYPHAEMWGRAGWTFKDLAAAQAHMAALLAAQPVAQEA